VSFIHIFIHRLLLHYLLSAISVHSIDPSLRRLISTIGSMPFGVSLSGMKDKAKEKLKNAAALTGVKKLQNAGAKIQAANFVKTAKSHGTKNRQNTKQEIIDMCRSEFIEHHVLFHSAASDEKRAYDTWYHRANEGKKKGKPVPNTVVILKPKDYSNFAMDCMRCIEKGPQATYSYTSIGKYQVMSVNGADWPHLRNWRDAIKSIHVQPIMMGNNPSSRQYIYQKSKQKPLISPPLSLTHTPKYTHPPTHTHTHTACKERKIPGTSEKEVVIWHLEAPENINGGVSRDQRVGGKKKLQQNKAKVLAAARIKNAKNINARDAERKGRKKDKSPARSKTDKSPARSKTNTTSRKSTAGRAARK